MNVDDVIRERIEAARRKAEADKQRREELAAARTAGLPHRHARKLYNLARSAANGDPMPRTPRALFRAAVCPSCRTQRNAKRVATVTVGGTEMDVVRCPIKSCELTWCLHPERPRTAAA
ncbi:hypothetical protein [Streptomyces sp. NBC_00271]|uniref:hypothetical protein n=1 Tax=Streptomyces sp. NBC_00271 TaxID=2975697 RepID=UPI002E281D47|nr:hypothetical protein [Streptomyces sp. NBC_00271]